MHTIIDFDSLQKRKTKACVNELDHMFCTNADISWNTRSSSLLSRSGLVDHGVDQSLDPSFTIFQPCFGLRKWLECDTVCTFVRVSFIWPTLAIATIPFSWFLFCHVEHCQLTTCSVWHESLPDHFSPCQNMWAPHYAAVRDWLKPKGVSALTDRSGVVYSQDCHPTVNSPDGHGKMSRLNQQENLKIVT